ncbi:MAG: GTPase HflX [Acidobacteria bacterium]|nr:GTPase HflX [Acidobacteriota bacterium]
MQEPSVSPASRAFLMGLVLPSQPGYVVEENLDELAELARSTGMDVVGRSLQGRRAPDARTLIGRGKVEEIARAADELRADVVIFDDDLTPNQVRNLEETIKCAVIDRSGLILDLFVRQARTREARTQVELAQLEYQLPRLTRRWTHLSRQAGGIGVRGGEGETQLEADRRMVRTRIKQLKKELSKIEQTRELHRRGRRDVPIIAFAGYTNAGKSTLFNRFTHAGVRAENRLFATLDPRLRKGSLGGTRTAVFADTVGFIRKLPHHLVASFRSTLEEITQADIVLHVIDRSHPRWREQMEVGETVLADIGVDMSLVLPVFNKMDLWGAPGSDGPEPSGANDALAVSARTGAGIEELRAHLLEQLNGSGAGGNRSSPLSLTP